MTSTVNTDLLASLGLLQGSGQASGAPGTSAQASDSAGKPSNQLTQQDFLKLMTAQLNNQDPNSPMDSSTILNQIAQLSTVSSMGSMQTSMQSLVSSLTSEQGLQASTLVGHAVAVPSSAAVLPSGGRMQAGVNLSSSASDVSVDITDQSGQVLKHLDLGPQASGMVSFSWDGTTTTGATAAPGLYNVQATATVNGQSTSEDVYAVDTVDSVTLNNGTGPTLNLNSLGSVDFLKVKQIM